MPFLLLAISMSLFPLCCLVIYLRFFYFFCPAFLAGVFISSITQHAMPIYSISSITRHAMPVYCYFVHCPACSMLRILFRQLSGMPCRCILFRQLSGMSCRCISSFLPSFPDLSTCLHRMLIGCSSDAHRMLSMTTP